MISRRAFGTGVMAGGLGLLFPAKNAFSAEEKDILKIVRIGSDENPAGSIDIHRMRDHINQSKEIPSNIKSKRVYWQPGSGYYEEDIDLSVKVLQINRSPKPGFLLVKVGSQARPATSMDLKDIKEQLQKVHDDKNLTLVIHNNFEAEWIPTAHAGMRFLVTA